MTAKQRSHSDQRWALLPPSVVRCEAHLHSGTRCRREAEPGSIVCDQHGGTAAQVRRRAMERVMNSADRAIQFLENLMDDETAPVAERAKAARDLADRAGAAAAQVIKVVPDTEDPVDRLFRDLLADPSNFESTPAEVDDVIDAEVLEVEAEVTAPEPELPDAEVVRLPTQRNRYESPRRSSTPRHVAEGLRRLDERS